MKFKLIYPKWAKLDRQTEFHLPPHGPVVFAAALPDYVDIDFIDENLEEIDFDDEVDFVGISMMLTIQVKRGWEIADKYRSKGIKVIFGGIATMLHAEETILHSDAVFLGEAEGRMEQIFEDFKQNRLQCIEAIIQETGQTGFHFVDEAAPPKALHAIAEELLRRNVVISWWGNIRFEKSFTPELCDVLSESGCIAISGGLEVASDRLLKLMKKGVSVEQVSRVTKAFSDAGILVHAYLMYGFPTQTVHDTVDALEYVRQLFEEDCIQSGFFHRFACTVHSPVGKNPQEYGIELIPLPPVSFAKNDIDFVDPTGVDHAMLGTALNKALYNFMHGVGLDEDIRSWFEGKVPRSRVSRDFIAEALDR